MGLHVHGGFFYFTGAAHLLERAADRRRQAFRPGTRANIRSHVLLYVAFTQAFAFRDFPATARSLLAFAEFLLLTYLAPKSVLNALASIRHFHLDLELGVEAFQERAVVLWRRALPHTCRHVPAQAPPLTLELLERLCELSVKLGEAGVVMAALMALLFAAMARLSSFLTASARSFDPTRLPTFGDVSFAEGNWRLRIKWAKAHQDAASGYWVPLLPRGASAACPVRNWLALKRLRSVVGVAEPLFWTPGGERGGTRGRAPLSMPVARAWLGILLARLGRGSEGLTFHSFRRGASTTAFLHGATEQDIRRLGGWRSDAANAYLPENEGRRRAARALAGTSFSPL